MVTYTLLLMMVILTLITHFVIICGLSKGRKVKTMLIYNDNYLNLTDDDFDYYKDCIAEQEGIYPEGVTEDQIYNYWLEDIQFNFDEVRQDLKQVYCNDIYAIADIGRWDGRISGYKRLDCLEDILYCGEDYNTLETDQYNLTLTAIHHDGTNYITFRELKPDLSYEQIENFEEKLYAGKCSSRDLSRYTTSLKHKVEAIYQ